MVCERCLSKPATIHMTKIVNGVKTEVNLCGQCAKDSEEFGFGLDFNFNLQDFFGGMIKTDPDQNLKCSKCGLDYHRFNKDGRLGCANCYSTFQQKLNPIIKRIHGTLQHSGKIPKRAGGKIRILKRVVNLKEELRRAIEAEEFEKAAELRDTIKGLERSASGGDSNGHG